MTPPASRQPAGPPSGFDARGAVDLGALAAAREAQQQAEKQAQAAREAAIRAAETGDGSEDAVAAAEEGVYPGALILDVDEATFEAEVVNRSLLVPVVIDFWAEWCEPCKSLTPILERLVTEADGRWVLAKVDVDANQRVAQAFQIQSIPTLFAVVKGQPVPLFQGAQPEAQIRQVMDQLLLMAEQNGVTGRVSGTPGAAPVPAPEDLEPPVAPEIDEATDAIERGDLAAAAAAYQRLLDREPADANARAGLGLVGLLQRTEGVDPQAAVEAAGDALDDPTKTCLAADVLVLARRPEDAFTLLVDTVSRTTGEDRDRARAHLLGLFEVLGDQDPAVGPARRALAAALF
jgi:putative thioredoxin